MLGILLALIATSTGCLVCASLKLTESRTGRSLAPVLGLASLAILTTWCVDLGLPPSVMTAAIGVAAVGGAVLGARRLWSAPRQPIWPALLLGLAALIPAVLLGLAFAGVPVPVSNHDGAYHVETIDSLRRGISFETWYPHGFHATIAALLGFTPWIDTARGTLEASQGLAILAPLGVFGLAAALRLRPLAAAFSAVLLALSFVFPYDYHVWGGRPLGMNVVLALGLWAVALEWIRTPDPRWAALVGVFGGAIVLTHGTEVYTGAVGLAVLLVANVRRIAWAKLPRHLGLAALLAVVVAAPYLPAAVSWAHAGGASAVGRDVLDYTAAHPDLEGRYDWLQYGLGAVGAAAAFDLPLRLLLVLGGAALAMYRRQQRTLVGLWLTFIGVVFALDFLDLPILDRVFALTYPWLVDHRLRQVVTLFASLLSGYACMGGVDALRQVKLRWRARPAAWRRLAIACAVLAGFFAEGSAVSIYKRLDQAAQDGAFSSDDQAAMLWLRQNATPGELVANNFSADAGIWAPYKSDVSILLPRSGDADGTQGRGLLESHVADLAFDPALAAEACTLRIGYVYAGAKGNFYDNTRLDVAALERSPALEEVFRSGDTAIFRTRLTCDA